MKNLQKSDYQTSFVIIVTNLLLMICLYSCKDNGSDPNISPQINCRLTSYTIDSMPYTITYDSLGRQTGGLSGGKPSWKITYSSSPLSATFVGVNRIDYMIDSRGYVESEYRYKTDNNPAQQLIFSYNSEGYLARYVRFLSPVATKNIPIQGYKETIDYTWQNGDLQKINSSDGYTVNYIHSDTLCPNNFFYTPNIYNAYFSVYGKPDRHLIKRENKYFGSNIDPSYYTHEYKIDLNANVTQWDRLFHYPTVNGSQISRNIQMRTYDCL